MAFDEKALRREIDTRKKGELSAMTNAPTDSVYVCLDNKKGQFGFRKLKDINLKIFDKYDTLENHLVDLINEYSIQKTKLAEQDAVIEALLIEVNKLKNAIFEIDEKIETEGDLGI